MSKKPHRGTNIRSFLQEDGILEEVEARALKQALATVADLPPDLPKSPLLSTSAKSEN
jgi:hypothetical protein